MKPQTAQRGIYPFLPHAFQRSCALLWLKRTHAWTGLFGALLFLFLGTSGFLLNHRSQMKIDTGAPVEVAALEVVVGADRFADGDELAAWLAAQYGLTTKPGDLQVTGGSAETASFAGRPETPAERWELRFRGPNAVVDAAYLPAAGLITLKKTEQNVFGLLKELHKGHGIGIAFILLIDAAAGALVLMSLSGILLWSRLHGPRVAAAAIASGALVWFIAAVAPNLVTGQF
jgi:hypothetical protein